MHYKVLVVDDETANLRLLERLFRGTYDVMSAASGAEAIELLSVHDFSLIISDQRMPGMTGIEFLKRAAEMRPQTVRIMLTGYSDAEALVEAINSGSVYKYVTKPWVNEELLQTAKRALQHCESLRAQRQLQIQHERLQNRVTSLREIILTLVGEILESETPAAADLAYQRRERAVKIGRTLRLNPTELDNVSSAAFLFDFVASNETPENIKHRVKFEQSLHAIRTAPEFEEVLSILSFSDEHFDGTGAPNGYAGEEIPLTARIITVADVAARATVAGNSIKTDEQLSAALRQAAGSRLDPEVVDAIAGHDILQIPTDPSGAVMHI